MTKEERWQAVHDRALKRFDAIYSALRPVRELCAEDRSFYSVAGQQWTGDLGKQFENKPKFEANRIHPAIIRIFCEYRNNRITVDYKAQDGEEDDLSDVCDRLYRADEQDSVAEEAYDNAFEEAVGGGFGAWRLRTVYEDEGDEDNDKQRIVIEPIFDADLSVYFDLNSKRQDKSDAKFCFVLNSMTPEAYKDEYGDDPSSWPKLENVLFDWQTPDVVYVAEYYEVEEQKEKVFFFQTISGDEERYTEDDFEEDPTLRETLESVGSKELRQRTIKRQRVRKYILSGGEVLEDCGHLAGKYIPIVPVYGKRWFIDGVEHCMGHVRLPKDMQRLLNMQISRVAEISSRSSAAKPIFTPEQMSGHRELWAEDDVKDYPYLLANALTDAAGQIVQTGPIGYKQPPEIPPAMAVLLQVTEQHMMELLGNQQQGDKIVSNISAKAVERIQQHLDMQTFIYVSNLAKAMRRSGEIWFSMAQDTYVEAGRKMKGVDAQGGTESIELMRPVLRDGATDYENDLSKRAMGVTVEVGPSSNSQRQATIKSLMDVATISQDPETQNVLSSVIMMNIEGEGVGEVRDYFRRRMIKAGVVKPSDEELKELMAEAQNQPEDPNAEYLKSAAKEAEAKAVKAHADTVLTIARSGLTEAQTAETLAGIDAEERRLAMEGMKEFVNGRQSMGQPSGPDSTDEQR